MTKVADSGNGVDVNLPKAPGVPQVVHEKSEKTQPEALKTAAPQEPAPKTSSPPEEKKKEDKPEPPKPDPAKATFEAMEAGQNAAKLNAEAAKVQADPSSTPAQK